LSAGLPLLVAAPALALMLNAPPSGIPALLIALLATTPALSLLGTLGAALTLGSRRSGPLLALLVLPLLVPVLIFGAAAAGAAPANDELILFPLTILLAIDLVLLAVVPWASAAALRNACR
jgi:heme exporter protein B